MAHTPLSRYQEDLLDPEFEPDAAQQIAVTNLQRLYDDLLAYKEPQQNFLQKIGLADTPDKAPV